MPPKENLRLVSFDGSGGARTFSQLRIMGQIMHQLSYDRSPNEIDKIMLPCEHFDLMGGSGTGGLVAIMFARLRMSVEEASDEFFTIVEEVYNPEALSPPVRTQKLRECVMNLLERKGVPIDTKLMEKTKPGHCASFVLTSHRTNAANKVCLRTYPLRNQLTSPITIIDAVLATCVVQPTFSSVTCGSAYNKKEYIAAILGAANPAREVITEAHSLFGGESSVAFLLSVGAGHPGVLSLPPGGSANFHTVMHNMMNDCEQRAQEIERQIGQVGIYFRFSVEQGMQNECLGSVADPSQVVAQTESYIAEHTTEDKLSGFVRIFDKATRLITLAELEYSGGASISTSNVTLDTRLAAWESSHDDAVLTKLKVPDLECGPHTAPCMVGTRQDILERIHTWVADYNAPNILWLKGHPGVGKSAIASSVVEQLGTEKRLGSSFFFQRQKANVMTTSALWRMVAYDLARQYPDIRQHILAALKTDGNLPATSNIHKLFRELIQEPILASSEISMESIPVVVIDALDECGGLDGQHSEVRRSLVSSLESWSRLPGGFKLVLTSRDESDIARLFLRTQHHPIELTTGQTVETQSSRDIRTFLTQQLQQRVVHQYEDLLSPNWPGPRVVEDLANKASGLFIWAKTVVNFISLGEPQKRLKLVLTGSGTGDMKTLYSQVLITSFPHPNEDEINDFHRVVGTVILAKEPLSLLSVQHLLSMEAPTIRHICNGLRSVMKSRDTLRFHHQSFVDFMIDPGRCPTMFLIKQSHRTQSITLACFHVMKERLRFNICDLKSSYVRNSDVTNLDSRIEQCVPPHVSYASRFWAIHLTEAPFHVDIHDALHYFMDNQFLFWLEVLSLTKRVNLASSLLLLLIDWLRACGQDDTLAMDLRRFVAGFASVIAQSAPHIYLSALPFSPPNSAVSKQYRDQFPRTLAIQTGGLSGWPAIQHVLSGHTGFVNSVVCTPDGRRIISGSSDRTIRVWDVETGEVLAGPFTANGRINTIAISPNGDRLASGSDDGRIQVWDAVTGEVLAGPVGAHSASVSSMVFSPNGTRIISGSHDMEIRVWDAETVEIVLGPLKGHEARVSAVASSPDGTRIASGSWDQSIRIWHAATGQAAMPPLRADSSLVFCVAFSPDGTRLASGNSKRRIWIWGTETGEIIAGPLEGHRSGITSVGFSPDGTHVVSGSDDRTIRVWDAETGEVLAGPFHGPTGVRTVVFLLDKKRVASGSDDGTIRIWDIEMVQAAAGSFQGHSAAVFSAAFSVDGMRIVSASGDKTIQVWNSETGERIVGPVEAHSDEVNSAAFSPNGMRVVSGSDDCMVLVWDAGTGEVLVGPLQGHSDVVLSVAFALDGTRVVSGSWDQTIRVWDAETGQELTRPLKGHDDAVRSVAFSPDGQRVVSGSADKTIRVWNVTTGELVAGPFIGHNDCVRSVVVSPDGTRVISGSDDKTIRVWDIDTGEILVGPLKGHNGEVSSVAFSPDGKYMASGSWDNTIRFWDADTGELVTGPFNGHIQGVNSVAFSPDGKSIVSSSHDTTIRVWNTPTRDSKDTQICPFVDSSEMRDGWILGSKSELLFWVPPSLRDGLWWPNNRGVIGKLVTTKLELARFVHGESWSRCRG